MLLNDAMKKKVMKMSDLVRVSTFMNEWDGKQKKAIPTTNQRLRDLKEYGLDSYASIKDFKQLKEYDLKAFNKILNGKGITYNYQNMIFNIKRTKNKRMAWLITVDNYGTTSNLYIDTYTSTLSHKGLITVKDAKIRRVIENAWNVWHKHFGTA